MICIYSKPNCSYCVKAKQFCTQEKIEYTEIIYDPTSSDYTEKVKSLVAVTNHKTFPQIFVGRKFIGGYSELIALFGSVEWFILNDDDF